MEKQPTILDTDIGTDVDDAWALATVLASSELELVGVTTVYGNTSLRGSIVRKLLTLAGYAHIPGAIGQGQPLPGAPPIFWMGHEGEGMLNFDGSDSQDLHAQAAEMVLRSGLPVTMVGYNVTERCRCSA